MHVSIRTVASACTLVVAGAAQASIVSYTSSAAFGSQVAPGSYLETFTGGGLVRASSFSFSGGTPVFGYTVSSGSGSQTYRNGTFIANNTTPRTLIFTTTTGNISAFGGNFYLTDVSDGFAAGDVTLTIGDSLGDSLTQTFTPTSPGSNSFRGFTSDGYITSLVLSAPTLGSFNTADNVLVGQVADVQAVPEPSSLALAGLAGLLGLARVRRRAVIVRLHRA